MPSEALVEPRWVDVAVLTALNARIVAAAGEAHGLRDRGLLESAAARPAEVEMDSASLADTFAELIAHMVDEAGFAARLRPYVVALS